MFKVFFRFIGIAALSLIGMPAFSQSAALVVSNVDYVDHPGFRNAGSIRYMSSGLRRAGFSVMAGTNKDGVELHGMGTFFADQAADADRVLAILQGHFVHTTRDTWVLGSDTPRSTNTMNVGTYGMSVGAVLDIMAQRSGRAVLFLVPSNSAPDGLNGLETGIGNLDIPQGVTVVIGSPNGTRDLVNNTLLRAGSTTVDLLNELPSGMGMAGFASDAIAFIDAPQNESPVPDTDLLFWQIVQSINSVEAYQAYLDQFPFGNHSAQAQQNIDTLQNAPLEDAQNAEAALNLTRDQRREIQRAFTILDYDTRGIDGIFGPGTRGAITEWQRHNGLEPTGYLDNDQLRLLGDQARRRAAELEEEARQRQLEEERQDRAYWQATGATGTEEGLRDYLERYPDGLFADVAMIRLEEIEQDRRNQAEVAERNAWDDARAQDTIRAYRTYLRMYPNGLFEGAARDRIQELQNESQNQEEIEALERQEAQVVGNPLARVLVERRLATLGYEPGAQDGNFDADARRAIRRFQRDQGLIVTGYVDEGTIVRLLVQ